MRLMKLVCLLVCFFLLLHLVSCRAKKNKVKKVEEEEEEDLELDDDDEDETEENDSTPDDPPPPKVSSSSTSGKGSNAASQAAPAPSPPQATRRQGFNVRSWSIRPAMMPPSPVLLVPHPVPAPVFVNRPVMFPVNNSSFFAKQNLASSSASMNPTPSHPGESIQKPNTVPTLPLHGVNTVLNSPPTQFGEGRSLSHSPSNLFSHSSTTTTSGSTATSALADDIRCEKRAGENYLSAHLIPPAGYSATPYIPLKPDLDVSTSSTCNIILDGMSYKMLLRDFSSCGVISRREPDGKEWLTVSVLFPLVNGLKTPDDEVVTIKCKPQDRSATANYAVDYHGNLVSRQAQSRSSVFQNREQELQCELGLYRRAGPATSFSNRLDTGSAIELGQELQLRASVRTGDGWNFAKISDVVVQRVGSSSNSRAGSQTNVQKQLNDLLMAAAARLSQRKKGRTKRQFGGDSATAEYAHLVLSDGCRNPAYRAIAPSHPEADPSNGLEIGFNFRAFMFRAMSEGEAVRITARITACIDEAECQLMQCPDDGGQGFGRRKRRHTSKVNSPKVNSTADFDRNLTFVIWTSGQDGSWSGHRYEEKEPQPKTCAVILISAAALTVFLSSIAAITAIVAILRRRKNNQCTSCRTKSSFGSAFRLYDSSKISSTQNPTSRAVLNSTSPIYVANSQEECPRYESIITESVSEANTIEPRYVEPPTHLSKAVSRTSHWSSVQDLLKIGNSNGQKPHRNQMNAGSTWYDGGKDNFYESSSSIDRRHRSTDTLNRTDSFLKTFQAFLATSFLNSLRQSFRGRLQTVNLNPNVEPMTNAVDKTDNVRESGASSVQQKHVNIVQVSSPRITPKPSSNNASTKTDKIVVNANSFVNLEATVV